MKKVIMVIVAGSLLAACGEPGKKEAGIPKNSDWNADNLKGMVKTLEIMTYTPDSTGAIDKPDSCCSDVQHYDEQGYFTSFESKTTAGIVSTSGTATRYPDGRMKEFINMKHGKQQGRFSIELDEKGQYAHAIGYDSNNVMDIYYTDITDNDFGAITGAVAHHPDSSIKESFKSVYQGPIMESSTTTDSLGKTKSTFMITLNDKLDREKTIYTNHGKDSTTTEVETFTYETYDDQGNWTQRTTYDKDGKPKKVVKRTITYYPKA